MDARDSVHIDVWLKEPSRSVLGGIRTVHADGLGKVIGPSMLAEKSALLNLVLSVIIALAVIQEAKKNQILLSV